MKILSRLLLFIFLLSSQPLWALTLLEQCEGFERRLGVLIFEEGTDTVLSFCSGSLLNASRRLLPGCDKVAIDHLVHAQVLIVQASGWLDDATDSNARCKNKNQIAVLRDELRAYARSLG